VLVHGEAVGNRQNEAGADPARGADGAEQIEPVVAPVARRGRTAALGGPDARQGALLAAPCLVLPPEFDRLAAGVLRDRRGNQLGEVLLCAA